MLKTESKWLKFKLDDFATPDGKDTFLVLNKLKGHSLGELYYHARWHSYVFYNAPEPLLLSAQCLQDIAAALNELNEREGLKKT